MPIGKPTCAPSSLVTQTYLTATLNSLTASCFSDFTVPPDTLDINGQPVEITQGLINTVDNVSLLYDDDSIYTIENGIYTKIGPYPSSPVTNPDLTHRFKSTFTNTGNANITYTGTSAILVDSSGTEVDYISDTDIPAGTYTLYGLNITKVNFYNNVFTDIHIERNEDQTNADYMFYALYNLVNFTAEPDTFGNVTSMRATWLNSRSLTSFPSIDTSSVTSMRHTWGYCSSLTSFPLIDTSSVISMRNAWEDCTSLTTFPLIDVSSVTNMQSAWVNCTSLTSFPLIDTSSVTNMFATWANCTSLTSFPIIDTSSVITMFYTWRNCNSLTSFPIIDISSVTDMSYAWRNCTSLICMGGFNNNGIAPTNTSFTFYNTPALLAPNATELTSILNGNTWLNPNPC